MANENIDKLYQILDAFERAGKDKKEIEKARDLLDDGNLGKALEIIRKLNNSINSSDKDEKKYVSKNIVKLDLYRKQVTTANGKVFHFINEIG